MKQFQRQRQLALFSRDCPGCGGTGWRTLPNAQRNAQTGGRGWYDLLFQCMARSDAVITRKTWGWVEEIFHESVPYDTPFTSAWTRRVVELLNDRFEYRVRSPVSLRERCRVCGGKRRVSLTTYETYFLKVGS